ncbi:MAG: hypothetical protein ACI4TX_04685 [Christensenellales bacterium]
MSIIKWFFKTKKEMGKTNTKRVKLGKYTISSHAQNRIADKKRNLKKKDMVINLFGNSTNSNLYERNNTTQYDRLNKKNRTITHITQNNVVKTIHKYHKKSEEKELNNFKRRK